MLRTLQRVRQNWTIVVACLLFGGIGAYLTWLLHAAPQSQLYHQFGSYSLINTTDSPTAAGLKTAQSMGMSFSFGPYLANGPTMAQYAKNNFKYVDVSLKNIIYAHFCDSGQTYNCTFNAAKLQAIESEARTAVRNAEQDNNVLAYYDLDDYYGDVTPALQVVRRVVKEEAAAAKIESKPILCGLGRNLERRATPNGPVLNTSAEIAVFEKVMANYSPATCDLPVVYIYAGKFATPSDSVDYGMSGALPWMLDHLKQNGWDSSTGFIGIAQAYGSDPSVAVGSPYYSVTPTKADVTTQVTAFCKYGAMAVMGYVWQDSQLASRYELTNSSDLRAGFSAGISACKNMWNPASSVTTPATPTTVNTQPTASTRTATSPTAATTGAPSGPGAPSSGVANQTPVAASSIVSPVAARPATTGQKIVIGGLGSLVAAGLITGVFLMVKRSLF